MMHATMKSWGRACVLASLLVAVCALAQEKVEKGTASGGKQVQVLDDQKRPVSEDWYDSQGRLRERTEYTYEGTRKCPSKRVNIIYDLDGKTVRNRATYTYDEQGREIEYETEHFDAEGNKTGGYKRTLEPGSKASKRKKTEWEWDPKTKSYGPPTVREYEDGWLPPQSGFFVRPEVDGAVVTVGNGLSAVSAASVMGGLWINGMQAGAELGVYGSSQGFAERLTAITVGGDVMPTVWTDPCRRLRAYVRGGLNFGVGLFDTSGVGSIVTPTGGLTLGAGVGYRWNRGTELGLEAGVRTQVTPATGFVAYSPTLFLGVSGTFNFGQPPAPAREATPPSEGSGACPDQGCACSNGEGEEPPPPPPGTKKPDDKTQEPPKPAEPPKATTPPAQPQVEYLCGPDITGQVESAMKQIIAKYDKWTPAEKEDHCDALFDPRTAESAWDIIDLSPAVAPHKDDTPERQAEPHWFERYASNCCKPRYPCGPTVEFMGACIHGQVVNYVMWGVVNELCGTWVKGPLAHWARKTAGEVFGGPSAYYEEQKLMVDIGNHFTRAVREQQQAKSDKSEQDAYKAAVKGIPAAMKALTRAEAQCKLGCKLTADEKKELNRIPFDFRWLSLSKMTKKSGSSEGSDERDRRGVPDPRDEDDRERIRDRDRDRVDRDRGDRRDERNDSRRRDR